MLVFLSFVILLALTVANENRLSLFRTKSREDWVLDAIGLCFQGIIIPILQMTVVYQIYQHLLGGYRASLNVHPMFAFFLSFIFVDYLYYWNHRLFHTPWFWCIHQVHHTVTKMDVLGTSRNTLWTSFLIIYLWVHPLFIYLLENPFWYVLGVSLTSVLDLWRHSIFTPKTQSLLYYYLSPWFILPQDHTWHHASNDISGNYGANLKIWDRIHGTCCQSDELPKSLGIQTKLTLTQKLFLPF
jgi:sterol desaturase/sphingolipid hydroxylase (fatty acid hydroxylase superfamily)